MMEKMWLGLWCIGAALVLGALGDILLRGTPWGINVFLWTLALVAFVVAPLALRGASWMGRWMLPASLLFAGFVAWRDSAFLTFLNVCAVLACLSVAAWGRAGRLRLRGLSGYALSSIYSGAFAVAGPIPTAVSDTRWDGISRDGWRRPVLSVLLGLCIAAPLLFVFGGLLIAADAVFADIASRTFDFDAAQIFSHAFLILFLAWISAGFLRAALGKHDAPDPSIERPNAISLGPVEVGVALGLLDALFLAFVIVQARYLFGGAQRVAAGLTYAEYARSGFFELVAVVALVVPVLLLAHWLFVAGRRGRLLFGMLTMMTVALVLVIMASAMWRMNLYYEAFGLTELRFYATAFIVWLGAILAFLTATVIQNRRSRFASWTIASCFAAVIALNAMNPDALIARANIERMEEGKRLDAYYLTLLSDDAAPAIARHLPEIGDRRLFEHEMATPSGKEREVYGPTLEKAMIGQWKAREDDWRTWNTSRIKAQEIAGDLEAR